MKLCAYTHWCVRFFYAFLRVAETVCVSCVEINNKRLPLYGECKFYVSSHIIKTLVGWLEFCALGRVAGSVW